MDPAALANLLGWPPSTSELAERVQRLEAQLAQARAEILEMRQWADRKQVSHAMVARARLGGLARAADALRNADGTFMSLEDLRVLRERIAARAAEDYERHARGGRARASGAQRNKAGRFTPA
jgi:hypothetical protein